MSCAKLQVLHIKVAHGGLRVEIGNPRFFIRILFEFKISIFYFLVRSLDDSISIFIPIPKFDDELITIHFEFWFEF